MAEMTAEDRDAFGQYLGDPVWGSEPLWFREDAVGQAIRAALAAERAKREAAEAEVAWLREASPDDLRSYGWSVAVHNDYRQDGEDFTFWLLTMEDHCVKGEGRTDAEALNQIRRAIAQKDQADG